MAQFEGVWKKRYMLTEWILQILVALVYIIICIIALASGRAGIRTGAGIFVIIASSVLIGMDIIEIVKYARKTLNPIMVLVFACLKMFCFGIYVVLLLIAAATGYVSVLDIFFSLILATTALMQLIVSAVLTHRMRQGRLHPTPQKNVDDGYPMSNNI